MERPAASTDAPSTVVQCPEQHACCWHMQEDILTATMDMHGAYLVVALAAACHVHIQAIHTKQHRPLPRLSNIRMMDVHVQNIMQRHNNTLAACLDGDGRLCIACTTSGQGSCVHQQGRDESSLVQIWWHRDGCMMTSGQTATTGAPSPWCCSLLPSKGLACVVALDAHTIAAAGMEYSCECAPRLDSTYHHTTHRGSCARVDTYMHKPNHAVATTHIQGHAAICSICNSPIKQHTSS